MRADVTDRPYEDSLSTWVAAIHLASAMVTGCDVVLTRDRQMARACAELRLDVA